MTVCKMKLNTGDIFSKIGPNAKLHRITIVTLTVLFAIRMVARSRSGADINSLIMLPLGVSSISSSWDGVSEKKAISLPEIKPEMRSAKAAIDRAMI